MDTRDELGENIASANLAVQAIPYPDSHFKSVSAYDFFEHIPRVVVDVAQSTSFFLFVNLMSKIWRALELNELFYIITPAYPIYNVCVDSIYGNFIAKKHTNLL